MANSNKPKTGRAPDGPDPSGTDQGENCEGLRANEIRNEQEEVLINATYDLMASYRGGHNRHICACLVMNVFVYVGSRYFCFSASVSLLSSDIR